MGFTSPATSAVPPGTLAVLVMFSDGVVVTSTEAPSVSGGVSLLSAVAVLSMLPPASISAWVTTWLPVYAQASPTSSRLSLSPTVSAIRVRLLMNGSLTVTPLRVWLAVFATAIV